MELAKVNLGLLMNFNVAILQRGIKRFYCPDPNFVTFASSW
jgi:hypothetical protein